MCAIILVIRFVEFIKEHSLGSTNKSLDCKEYVLIVTVFFRKVWFLTTQQNLTKVFFGVRVGFIFKQTFQFVYKLCSGMVI